MQKIIKKILAKRWRLLQFGVLVIVLGIVGIIFSKNIARIFATGSSDPLPGWCTYDYTDDEINGASGWWQNVQNYYQYTEPETHDYSFNLKPVKNFSGLVSGSSGTKGRLVNAGANFSSTGSGAFYNVWLYSFSGEDIKLKMLNITLKSSSSQVGPVYSYKLYDKDGTLLKSVYPIFYNNTVSAPADPAYPTTTIVINESVESAGAYRLEIDTNFASVGLKPTPGYPISFGYQADHTFPFSNTGQGFYFYAPTGITKIFADLRVEDPNTEDPAQYRWLDPDGNYSTITTPSGEIDRRDSYALSDGGALAIKDCSGDCADGIWKIDVSAAASFIEQLHFYNVPNVVSNDRQYLMVPQEVISDTDNALCTKSSAFNIDKIVVAGATSDSFNGTYDEVLEGPEIPTDLMPSDQDINPTWETSWDGKKNEIAVYQSEVHSSIYLLRSLGPTGFTALGTGYYIIFDSTAVDPTSEWYAFPATSTALSFAGKDSPLDDNWQKIAGTWDAGTWTAMPSMTATDSTTPETATCP